LQWDCDATVVVRQHSTSNFQSETSRDASSLSAQLAEAAAENNAVTRLALAVVAYKWPRLQKNSDAHLDILNREFFYRTAI
jgi:hypothetical protein